MKPRKFTAQINKFGSIILEQRVKAGLTQLELAKLAGIDVRTVRRIENGEFAIGFEKVLGLSKALKLQPSELLEEIKLKFEKVKFK